MQERDAKIIRMKQKKKGLESAKNELEAIQRFVSILKVDFTREMGQILKEKEKVEKIIVDSPGNS